MWETLQGCSDVPEEGRADANKARVTYTVKKTSASLQDAGRIQNPHVVSGAHLFLLFTSDRLF